MGSSGIKQSTFFFFFFFFFFSFFFVFSINFRPRSTAKGLRLLRDPPHVEGAAAFSLLPVSRMCICKGSRVAWTDASLCQQHFCSFWGESFGEGRVHRTLAVVLVWPRAVVKKYLPGASSL